MHHELVNADFNLQELSKNNEKDDFSKLAYKNVLLVEDHPLNAQIARKLCENKKMNVVYAKNGKVAIELFKSSPAGEFDIILMDIRMPEMSGLEATKAIREMDRKDACLVPIIAMSANAYEEDIKKSILAGMNEHISKPVYPELLYKTMCKHIKDTKN